MSGERFSYRTTRSGKDFAWWHGRNGKGEIVLSGSRADRLVAHLAGMDPAQEQLARATSNFRHGNERPGRQRRTPAYCSGISSLS